MRPAVKRQLAHADALATQFALAQQEQKKLKRRAGFVGGAVRERVDQLPTRKCRHCSTMFTPIWRGMPFFCSWQCDEAYCHNAVRGIRAGFVTTLAAILQGNGVVG